MGVGRARHTRERLQAMTPMGSSAPQDLAEVYRTTYRALVRFLYRKVWDAERAEDLAQEAFARALIHKPESARGWLFIVAANMARDEEPPPRAFGFVYQGPSKGLLRQVFRALGVPHLAVQEPHERAVRSAVDLREILGRGAPHWRHCLKSLTSVASSPDAHSVLPPA